MPSKKRAARRRAGTTRRRRGRPKLLSEVAAAMARKRNSMKTKAERSEQARKAALARWGKAREEPEEQVS